MINEEALKIVLNDKTFGQRTAASIVGGRGRLYDLVGKGLIRCEKPTKAVGHGFESHPDHEERKFIIV